MTGTSLLPAGRNPLLLVALVAALLLGGSNAAPASALTGAGISAKTSKLTRSIAIKAGLDAGFQRTGLPVKLERVKRTGRRSFRVKVSWIVRSASGVDKCQLGVGVALRRRLLVTPDDGFVCAPTFDNEYFGDMFQTGPGPKYCPGTARTWDAQPELVGRTFAEAAAIAATHGCQVRIVREDGTYLTVTQDFSPSRLNVEVEGPEKRVVSIHSVS